MTNDITADNDWQKTDSSSRQRGHPTKTSPWLSNSNKYRGSTPRLGIPQRQDRDCQRVISIGARHQDWLTGRQNVTLTWCQFKNILWSQFLLKWTTSWRIRCVVPFDEIANCFSNVCFSKLVTNSFRHSNNLQIWNSHDGRLAHGRKVNTKLFWLVKSCYVLQNAGVYISRKWELELVYSTRPACSLW
jgi:hypothetical protein